MRKSGIFNSGYMPRKNVGLISAVLLSVLTIPTAHAATCSTQSSYVSGTIYTASNCSTYNAQTNFTAGGYVRSCQTCNSGYTRYSKTMTHSSGCTFTMYDCVASDNYAYVVTTCASTTNTTYKNACNSGTNINLDSDFGTIASAAGISTTTYSACGVYNIRNVAKETPEKVLLCFKSQMYINGQEVDGGTMANNLEGCASGYRGDDYTTHYRDTDWGGTNGEYIAISNYALWSCCNSTSCTGYADLNGTMVTGLLQRPAKYCLDTGTCSSSISGGYITCDTGYYSTKGKSTYTVTSSGNPNPANYSSYLSCKLCSASDATNHSSATSEIGSDAITDCYLPTGYSETDTTGTWKYASDCHYSN